MNLKIYTVFFSLVVLMLGTTSALAGPPRTSDGYCQLKSNWADFLSRARNLNAEQSMSYAMSYEFLYCPNFGQIHLT